MRLKTQFRLMSAASGIIPLLATAMLAAAANRADIISAYGRQFQLLRDRIDTAIRGGAGDADLIAMIRAEGRIDVALEDSLLRPVAWNSPEARMIDASDPAGLASVPGGLLLVRVGTPERMYYLACSQPDRGAFRRDLSRSRAAAVATYLLLIFLVPVLTSLGLNSMLKAIRRLQEATGRISEGGPGEPPPASAPDEIAALWRSFDEMRLALRREEERKSRFLMSISHDLKTPLAAIRGYLEALRDGHGATAGLRDRYLSIIEKKSMLLESRVREILDFASLSTDDWQVTLAPVDLREYITAIASEFADEASVFGRSFRSRVDIAPGSSALLDRALFGRCLENIFFNAVKFTGEGGSIAMSCERAGHEVELVISDDGPGFSETDVARAFEPFHRGSASSRSQGMGLGLSIVKSIIEAHGFSISVRGRGAAGRGAEGRGAVIAVRIPTAPEA
jgi:signal transduction histidine kinase